MPPPAVIALFGPTAVGKTAVAIALADRLRRRSEDPVAVSADALQVYEGLEVLTGAATREDRRRLEHRLLSFVPVDRTFSAGEYAGFARAEIDALLSQGRRPLVVGGTGLYLAAAVTDMDFRPPPPPGARERWTAQLAQEGAPALHALLEDRWPAAAGELDPHDGRRIVRAFEAIEAGALEPRPKSLWSHEMRHPTLLVGLVMEREALRRRIDERVDRMIAEGALDEARRAEAGGASETARKALGFEDLLAGDIEAMRQRTRRYAKRQMTWLRKLERAHIVDVSGRAPHDVAAEVHRLLQATPPLA